MKYYFLFSPLSRRFGKTDTSHVKNNLIFRYKKSELLSNHTKMK